MQPADFTRRPPKRNYCPGLDFDFSAHTDAELRRDFDALVGQIAKTRSKGMKAYLGTALKLILGECHYRAAYYNN